MMIINFKIKLIIHSKEHYLIVNFQSISPFALYFIIVIIIVIIMIANLHLSFSLQ